VYCCCVWSLQLSTLWRPACSQQTGYRPSSVWQPSHKQMYEML
jgi:hypothetical protein